MFKENYLHLLHEIELSLNGGRTVRRGLSVTLQKVMLALKAEAISLSYDPGLQMIELPATFGATQLLIPEDDQLIEIVQSQVKPILITDKLPAGAKAILVARIQNGNERVGLLQLVNCQDDEWTNIEQMVCQIVADQLGVALSNADTFWQLRRQATELQWINQFIDSLLNLMSSLRIDKVAERIMLATRELLDVEAASILLKDYESDDLILWNHAPLDEELSIRLKPGQGIAGWTFQYGKSTIVNHVRDDPRWEPTIDNKDSFQTRSLIAVPIFMEENVIGVVEAVNKIHGEFDDSDEATLHTLAKWAAIAIGNANAYDDLRRTSQQLIDAQKQAAMANMVLNMAHKINNAVGAVRVWAMDARDELEKTSINAAELRTFVDNTIHNAEETLLMVRRIRGATELQIGDIQKIHVQDTVDAALQFSRLSPSVTIERYYDIHPLYVGADPERLVEVFLNIINNAADVLDRDGRIITSCRQIENGMVEVLIQDNGSGIPQHLRDHVFDPFISSKADGLGLGLWMVKLYVELLGGTIGMNTSTKGTTFRIILPPWEAK